MLSANMRLRTSANEALRMLKYNIISSTAAITSMSMQTRTTTFVLTEAFFMILSGFIA